MTFQPIQDVLPDGRKFSGGYVDALPESEKKRDNRDWARCILKRMSNGEHVPMIAEQFAKEALQAPGAKP